MNRRRLTPSTTAFVDRRLVAGHRIATDVRIRELTSRETLRREEEPRSKRRGSANARPRVDERNPLPSTRVPCAWIGVGVTALAHEQRRESTMRRRRRDFGGWEVFSTRGGITTPCECEASRAVFVDGHFQKRIDDFLRLLTNS